MMMMKYLFYFPLLFLIHGYRRSRRELSSTGQALLETMLVLPLLISISSLFLILAYDQLWTQTIEHLLHEALVCEQALMVNAPPNYCLQTSIQAAPQANLLGDTFIYKISQDYYAELRILGKFRWKIIHLSENSL